MYMSCFKIFIVVSVAFLYPNLWFLILLVWTSSLGWQNVVDIF